MFLLKAATYIFLGSRFHKSWAQGANHRDSSIHLRPLPTPNFLRIFLRRKSWAQGRRAQKQFMKSTPGRGISPAEW